MLVPIDFSEAVIRYAAFSDNPGDYVVDVLDVNSPLVMPGGDMVPPPTTFEKTGGWSTWETKLLTEGFGNLTGAAGQFLHVAFDNSSGNDGGMNPDYVEFRP